MFGDAEDLLLFGELANVRVRSTLYGAVFVRVQNGEDGLWGVLQCEYADGSMRADAPDKRQQLYGTGVRRTKLLELDHRV